MGPGPREGAGACSFAARAGGGGCWERPRRIRRGAMIPAARRRRLSGKRLGRRAVASGDSAPAGGLVQRGCAPHCRRRKVRSAPFPPAAKTAPAPLRLLSPPRGARRGPFRSCPKRERAAPGVREKALLATTLHVRAKLLYGSRRERVPAGLRWLPDGRGGVRCRLDSGFPRRGCALGRGARRDLTSSSFPVSRCGAPRISVTSVPLVPPFARSASLRAGRVEDGKGG